jgi:hypothetical protein
MGVSPASDTFSSFPFPTPRSAAAAFSRNHFATIVGFQTGRPDVAVKKIDQNEASTKF